MDRFPSMRKGTKVRVKLDRGTEITGVLVADVLTFDSIMCIAGGLRLAVNLVESVEVLALPAPVDDYPIGTVVRWTTVNGFRTAVKRRITGGGVGADWYIGTDFVDWKWLLEHRPLTVMAESTILTTDSPTMES